MWVSVARAFSLRIGEKKFALFPSLCGSNGEPKQTVEKLDQKNASFLEPDSNLGDKAKLAIYYRCATVSSMEIFSASESKKLKMRICHCHISKCFAKYFLKIFSKS